jgi:carboxyl-terminal processing protease
MKRWIFAVLTSLTALFGSAQASPAQDLFDQAVYLLLSNYGGFSSTTPKVLAQQFQLELDQACAAQVETCPYSAAHPVINNLFEALNDGHSGFIPANYFSEVNNLIRGSASSGQRTGLMFSKTKNSASVYVYDVYPNSPASKAGLRRADRIVAVNGLALARYEARAYELLNGAKGVTVRLMVVRAGQVFEVTLEPVILPPVPSPSLLVRDDGVAVLRLPDFLLQGLGKQINTFLKQAEQQQARGLILDLRDNGGGLVNEYVEVIDAFMTDPGRVFDSSNPLRRRSPQFRDGSVQNGPIEARAIQSKWKKPLVVLVNKRSASASEFTAFDLQHYAKATVVGEPTVGVGNTVTTVFPLEDGSGLAITLAKAVQPNGTPYPERITPDVAVTDDLNTINFTGRDALFEKALEVINK